MEAIDLTDYMKVAIEAFLGDQGVDPADLDQGDLNDILVALMPVVSAVLYAYREAHRPAPEIKFREDIG